MCIGDLLDEKLLFNAINDSDVVYNFSGTSDIDAALTLSIDIIKKNILWNDNMLNACKTFHIKRYMLLALWTLTAEKEDFKDVLSKPLSNV